MTSAVSIWPKIGSGSSNESIFHHALMHSCFLTRNTRGGDQISPSIMGEKWERNPSGLQHLVTRSPWLGERRQNSTQVTPPNGISSGHSSVTKRSVLNSPLTHTHTPLPPPPPPPSLSSFTPSATKQKKVRSAKGIY